MTVYVDDMRMKATVGNITARWSHLIADTQEELHEFAQKIGLRRAWFQEGKGKPGSYAAESWHYDVTDGIRARAIQEGARTIGWGETPEIIMRRMEEKEHGE